MSGANILQEEFFYQPPPQTEEFTPASPSFPNPSNRFVVKPLFRFLS
jgi:hypothetical protein